MARNGLFADDGRVSDLATHVRGRLAAAEGAATTLAGRMTAAEEGLAARYTKVETDALLAGGEAYADAAVAVLAASVVLDSELDAAAALLVADDESAVGLAVDGRIARARDVYSVADEADRAALVVTLGSMTPPIVATALIPIIVWRRDLGVIEVTTNGSAWVRLPADAEPTAVTLTAGMGFSLALYRLSKAGRVVNLTLSVFNDEAKWNNGTFHILTQLPVGYRPVEAIDLPATFEHSGGFAASLVTVATTGEVSMKGLVPDITGDIPEGTYWRVAGSWDV